MRKSTGHMAWMLGLGWIAVLALGGCGAQPLPASRPAFLAPGKEWTLTVRSTMLYTTVGTRTEKQVSVSPDGTITEKEVETDVHPPKTSEHWLEESCHLRSASRIKDGDIHLTGTVLKHNVDPGYIGSNGSSVIYDASAPDTSQCDTAAFEGVLFPARVDEAGQLSNLDPPTSDIWKQGASTFGLSKPIFGRRVLYGQSGIVLSHMWTALEDIVAYWPPDSPQVGQRWGGDRELIFPYHLYGFYMFSGGCGAMKETSTCKLVSIHSRAGQQIATIRIAGRRTPFYLMGQSRPSEDSDRPSTFTLTGTMIVNLTTPAVESLKLKSVAHYRSAEERRLPPEQYNESITLKPAPAKKAKK
jgi:hypothetical protein